MQSREQSGKSLGSYEFSLRAASCGLAFVNPDSQESAKLIGPQGLTQ
jgi:hypothetical protein